MHRTARLVAAALLLLAAHPASAANCAGTASGLTPMTELGTATHNGYEGGLYPGGANTAPAAHAALGRALAAGIVPRDPAGVPSPAGRIVLLTIGMSNTRNESARLVPLVASDQARNPAVLVVNGAQGGQDARDIADPSASYWSFVDGQVAAAGATGAQVQAVWLKQALARPTGGFPAAARELETRLRSIVQILRLRFPNLAHVYLSSRIYAGYASTTLNPEPYAYESAFSVKWLVASQIEGTYPAAEPSAGVVAPWLAWGPYLWADGTTPRADGMVWTCTDFAADGTHPSADGSQKVAGLILDFLHQDPAASAWYLTG